MRALTGARVFTGTRFLDGHAVLMDGRRIADVVPDAELPAGIPREPLDGGLLTPGFVDAQVNGGGGVLFNDRPTPDGAAAIVAAHRAGGTTGLLPTFITDAPAPMARAIAALSTPQPGVVGLHLEGPHLALGRKGAHPAQHLRPLSDADVDGFIAARAAVGTLLLTLAAEVAAPRQIRRLVDGGVIVSLGHSDASYEVAWAAADAGARGVTHLFNAMSQLGHRAPGVVGAALDHPDLWGGLIADGHHVEPSVLRIALRAKRGRGRLFLVTDAMPPAASDRDTFTLAGRTARRVAGRLSLDDGTLAGSDLTMDGAVRFAAAHLDVTLAEALRMASLYPAEFLGLDRGRIAAGAAADLVWLDDDLVARRTWVGGA